MGITYMLGSAMWEQFGVSEYVPDSVSENITTWKKELLSFAKS
jgi:hypothetical protein